MFHFVDNGAVSKCDLWKDGIHLLEIGNVIIANNFISSINYLLENTSLPISRFWTMPINVTIRIRDSLNRSSEMSINDVFPHRITEIKNLRGCLHEISFRAKWNIFISLSGQFLVTVYIIQPRMKLVSGVVSLRSFWQKWNFISSDKISCKHYPKQNQMKGNICTCVNKNDWFLYNGSFISGYLRHEIRFISPAMKSNVNRISFTVDWNFVLGRFHFGSHVNTPRLRNFNKVKIVNLNIDSLPNEFDLLREIVITIVTRNGKLDDTFLASQFLVTGFSVPYRLDQNRNGSRIMIFIRDDIPSRLLTKHVFPDLFKVNLLSWTLKKLSVYFLEHISRHLKKDIYYSNNLDTALDLYSHYDKKLLVGDTNTKVLDSALSFFLYKHELENLVKDKTCLKNANNSSTITFFWLIIL